MELLKSENQSGIPVALGAMSDVANDLANELTPVIYRAADAVLKTRQHLTHHFDDLTGEGFLVLARIIAKVQAGRVINNLPGYVFRSARRAMVRYLELRRGEYTRSTFSERDVGRHKPDGLEMQHDELLDELLACCGDDIDRQIIEARSDEKSMQEVGDAVGLDKSVVCRRLQAIERRYDQRNE